MACVKTGADVWLKSHECIAHGDLYKVGRVYVLNYVLPFKFCDAGNSRIDAIFWIPVDNEIFLDIKHAKVMVITLDYVEDFLDAS